MENTKITKYKLFKNALEILLVNNEYDIGDIYYINHKNKNVECGKIITKNKELDTIIFKTKDLKIKMGTMNSKVYSEKKENVKMDKKEIKSERFKNFIFFIKANIIEKIKSNIPYLLFIITSAILLIIMKIFFLPTLNIFLLLTIFFLMFTTKIIFTQTIFNLFKYF